MKFDEIIKSENTDGQFTRWTDYRNALTDLIMKVVQSDDGKPTLAIWGAGGCNDVDIERLSRVAKLVLIDCEKDRTISAIEKYGLDKSEAVAADLFFYDIPYESYEHWEELLREGANLEILHSFLSELLLEAVSTDMLVLPEFDYSVAVGLASQLNSRLAALLYLYRDNYSPEERSDILKHIAIMDGVAVGRLYDMVRKTTDKNVIWGCEESIKETGETLYIEGNKKLCELIFEKRGLTVTEQVMFDWPFIEGKTYDMKIYITG